MGYSFFKKSSGIPVWQTRDILCPWKSEKFPLRKVPEMTGNLSRHSQFDLAITATTI